MGFFPENYSRPVLVDIVKAAELGWNAACSPVGSVAGTGLTGCLAGSEAGAKSSSTGGRLFQSGSDESSSSRLINPGDVSQGL